MSTLCFRIGNQLVWTAPVAPLPVYETGFITEVDFDDGPPPLVDAPPYPQPGEFILFPPTDEKPAARKAPHSKKKPENHIPRPPNAFILFRSSFIKSQHVSTSVETNHSTLSKIIGITWKNMSESERQVWHAKAKVEQEEHRRKFPKYAFRPQQTKGKGGTGEKRKVREVEPKDLTRCKKIAELLVQGKKGEDLKAEIAEFDKHHVPTIVTRFEAPITERTYQRSSSAPIPDTELAAASKSFIPHSPVVVPRKIRARSTQPTRCATPAQPQMQLQQVPETPQLKREASFVRLPLSSCYLRLRLSQDFSSFSFENTHIATPFPCDPLAEQASFTDELSVNTSFMNDWSQCSSPVSPEGSIDFNLTTPVGSPSYSGMEFSQHQLEKDFNEFSQGFPTLFEQQPLGSLCGDSFLGLDNDFSHFVPSLDMDFSFMNTPQYGF